MNRGGRGSFVLNLHVYIVGNARFAVIESSHAITASRPTYPAAPMRRATFPHPGPGPEQPQGQQPQQQPKQPTKRCHHHLPAASRTPPSPLSRPMPRGCVPAPWTLPACAYPHRMLPGRPMRLCGSAALPPACPVRRRPARCLTRPAWRGSWRGCMSWRRSCRTCFRSESIPVQRPCNPVTRARASTRARF
jgi:hypothetical protein